jgi:AcrR family transcriptional regulator
MEAKEKIFAHAWEQFFSHGLSGISVEALTSELSMSKKTFYQVFDSKDDLVEQIMERKMGEVNQGMEHILDRPIDSVEKLKAMVAFMGETIGGISTMTFAELHRHYPNLWQRVEKFRRERLTRSISHLLEQGIREGFVRKEVNTRVFLLSYLAAIEGIMQSNILSHESFSSKEALEAIMDIFFKGILTESARIRLDRLQSHHSS